MNDEKLKEALDIITWFIENDETNEGDYPMREYGGLSWNDINGFWIDGLNRARKFVEENQKG